MLRQRQSQSRPWLYIGASFLAGAMIAYILLSDRRNKDLSWQDLDRQREVLSQQSLTSGHGEDVSVGEKKRVMAVVGVQVVVQAQALSTELCSYSQGCKQQHYCEL